MVSASYELARAEKDEFYDLSALMITLPIGFVAWLEALSCDAFLVSVGGHFWCALARPFPPRLCAVALMSMSWCRYDMTIPLSMQLYYYVRGCHVAAQQ